jgi:hypothetical protein
MTEKSEHKALTPVRDLALMLNRTKPCVALQRIHFPLISIRRDSGRAVVSLEMVENEGAQ